MGGSGMVSLTNGAIQDTTGLQVISKTLAKNQQAQQQAASMASSINMAQGKGTQLDVHA